MQLIKPPHTEKILYPSIFLAGTIDNGNSEDWQSEVETKLADLDVTILNPRREAWDSTWEQSISNPQFKEQVEWELEHLEVADQVLMYFAPQSKSPITLLELGLFAHSDKLTIVCPDGFWRKGNVEVVAARYDLALFAGLEEAVEHLLLKLEL